MVPLTGASCNMTEMHVAPDWFVSRLLAEATVRRIDERILSVLPADVAGAPYDRRAAVYDRLVRSPLYNRLVWSTRPADYAAFARGAVEDAPGPLLEVGCGSATFTAPAYRSTERPCVLVDRSVAMLERAAARVVGAGDMREDRFVLLQADLRELPFRPRGFHTVVWMGGLHLFDDVPEIVARLAGQCAPDGHLFLSGLVAETRVARGYLGLLHRAGEVVAPRREADLRKLVEAGLGRPAEDWRRVGAMVYARARVA